MCIVPYIITRADNKRTQSGTLKNMKNKPVLCLICLFIYLFILQLTITVLNKACALFCLNKELMHFSCLVSFTFLQTYMYVCFHDQMGLNTYMYSTRRFLIFDNFLQKTIISVSSESDCVAMVTGDRRQAFNQDIDTMDRSNFILFQIIF